MHVYDYGKLLCHQMTYLAKLCVFDLPITIRPIFFITVYTHIINLLGVVENTLYATHIRCFLVPENALPTTTHSVLFYCAVLPKRA